MTISGVLQLSLVSRREWASLFGRIEHVKRRSMAPVRSLSLSVMEKTRNPLLTTFHRCASLGVGIDRHEEAEESPRRTFRQKDKEE